MLIKYNDVINMEEWKKSVLIGAILLILAVIFAIIRNEFNIWIILIILLAVIDIIFGIIRKIKKV